LYVESIIKIKNTQTKFGQLTLESFEFDLGVIQIIRDTLRRGGGVDKMSHNFFLLFEILFLRLLDVKLFVTVQDKASKDLGLKLGD
jgi:hypothetical protein